MSRLVLLLLFSGISQAVDRVDLGGRWERRIGGKLYDVIDVPSSYRPVGAAVLSRAFDLPSFDANRRVVLRFEGVAHEARVSVNGVESGRLGPWTPYEFDVTKSVRRGANRIEVEVNDWQTPLGPSGAWEAYGGIVRETFIEIRPEAFVENVRVRYSLNASRDAVAGSIDVFLSSTRPSQGKVTARLTRAASTVSAGRAIAIAAGPQDVTLPFELKTPELWSPETPNLYRIEVTLDAKSGPHVFEALTGFRDLKILGPDFLLNGTRLVLRGVCRHDLWHNQGHTMRADQIEQDLRMIKGMGANFVRLVHYPHDRRVVEAANRIGLFVTEESGLVWIDTRQLSRQSIETGLDNLERTVRRDWNAPSLFAVFLANESAPDAGVIREFIKRIRPLAPAQFLSTARLDVLEKTLAASKRVFDETGLDFYTYHPYSYDADVFEEAAREFPGKPLLFSEWGGSAVGQSPILLKGSVDAIARLVQEHRVAGHSFWSWADLPEFSRGGDELADGILISGVVREDRTPKPDIYLGLAGLFRRPAEPSSELPGELRLLAPQAPSIAPPREFVPVSLANITGGPEQKEAWTAFEALMEPFWKAHSFTRRHWQETGRKMWFWKEGKLNARSVPFDLPARGGRVTPVLLTVGHSKIEIPIQLDRVAALHVLGNVTFPDGYPIAGRLGDTVGRYTIEYVGGVRREYPLRLGYEVARANMIAFASRVDPIAVAAERVAVYTKDPVREAYQILMLSLPTEGSKSVARLVCEFWGRLGARHLPPPSMHHDGPAAPDGQALAIFGITAEQSAP